ncbi:MAG: hypothetical protein COC01_06685 [Bacteroidetes bacterium]|nr:MAG: hypothetical protein COC01_06685 [Bacteroidota bacterium]
MKNKRYTFLLLVIGSIVVFLFIGYKHLTKNDPFSYPLNVIEAFIVNDSYEIGENINVYVHTESGALATLARLGAQVEEINWHHEIPPTMQSPIFDTKNGFTWDKSFVIKTTDLKPGMYVLSIEPKVEWHPVTVPFIIKPKSVKKVSVIASSNTWQAYNACGGISSYTDFRTPRYLRELYGIVGYDYLKQRYLPWSRPYPFYEDLSDLIFASDTHYSHTARGEWIALAFLEQHGLEYGVYSDHDFAVNKNILQSDLIIFQVHTEYWSEEMRENLKNYLDVGGHAIFLGGDNMTRDVEFYEHGIIINKKPFDRDSIEHLIGSQFSNEGFNTFAPYQVVNPNNWIFDGTEIQNGDLIGEYSSNNNGKQFGASGWETDKHHGINDQSSVLAKGLNDKGGAHMVFTESKNGGWVFSSGSIAFAGAMTNDAVIDKMMMNLISDALKTE